MKTFIFTAMLFFSTHSLAASPWLDNLNTPDKQQQLDLRWEASGGQVDMKFMYQKLNDINIQVSPKAEFPNKRWDYNHLVFPISNNSKLELQMPYGNIEKITDGLLLVDSNFSLTSGQYTVKVNSFKLVPTPTPTNPSDIVTFNLFDQNDRHLFTIDSVHIEYDREKSILLMSNMDLFATKELADLLHSPVLENQVVGQLHSYNQLTIPETAQRELNGGSCASHPIWPTSTGGAGDVDVLLMDIGSVQWVRNIGSDKIIVAPSARLKNVGTADVPWHRQFTNSSAPYNNDQHPFLNWSMYREVDGRFEQIGYSGVKHAFLTINSNCTVNCGDSHILWLGCEDVYGIGNNDSSFDLGPRSEISADTGVWENCGSFFDPKPCSGSHQNSSNGTDENRMTIHESDLTDPGNSGIYMQAWYLIRDDIDIFNTMGYRPLSPTPQGSGWSMNAGTFTNGAALDNYMPANTMEPMQASNRVTTGEGQFTVAMKVVDLGKGLFRYNYSVENYEFDPRFISFNIPLSTASLMTDTVFSDPDQNIVNDWQFVRSNDVLTIQGDSTNEQDWGMLFSFSFTTDVAPEQGVFTIDAAHPIVNSTVNATVLVPQASDLIYTHGFE